MNDANPYNGNSHSGDGVVDFRARAVVESARMCGSRSGGFSPERNGFSLCLEREPSLVKFRKPIIVTIVCSFILGLAGIGTGGIICYLQKNKVLADDPHLLAVAACCSIGGILFMFLPMWVERWIVRQHLSTSKEGPGAGAAGGGTHVYLENAETYSELKLLAEDVGLVFLHPEGQYIKICGLSYDYVIHARDVVALAPHSSRKGVLISYMVGNERLDLAVIPRSLWAEFKRQTIGSSRSLFKDIEAALGAQASQTVGYPLGR